MNTQLEPEELSQHLRELSPKRPVPPSDALSEVRRRFIEKYGYWPSALAQDDSIEEVTLDELFT